MTDSEAYINDFITIETRFENANNSFETSEYATVQDFFETHLSESINDEERLGEYGIDTYKIKIGEKIKLKPSQWAIQFSKKHNLVDDNDDYEYNYIIKDIELKMYSRNPKASGSTIPKLSVTIILERI